MRKVIGEEEEEKRNDINKLILVKAHLNK